MTAKASILESDDWYVGDDYPLRYQLLDEDGEPIDVSGYTCIWVFKERVGDPDALVSKSTASGIDVSAGSGYIDVSIEDTDTDALEAMTGVIALKRTTSGSEETLAEGTAVLKKAATG